MSNTKTIPRKSASWRQLRPACKISLLSVPLDFSLTISARAWSTQNKIQHTHTTDAKGGLGGNLALHLLSLGLRCSTVLIFASVVLLRSENVSAPLEQGTVMQPCTPSAPCSSTSPQNAPKGFHLDVNALGPTAKPRLPDICAARCKHRTLRPDIRSYAPCDWPRASPTSRQRDGAAPHRRPRKTHGPKNPLTNLAQKF